MKPREYELVLVLSPQLDEAAAAAVLEGFGSFIDAEGGEVASQELWGMRRLSYPIKTFSEGNYIFSQLRLAASAARNLEEKLTASAEVIRYLLVRKESPKPQPKIKAKVEAKVEG